MSPRPKPGVLEIAPYAPGRSAADGFAKPIKLSANENALGCCEAAREAFQKSSADLHLYPDPSTSSLRAAVAAKFDLEPERLVFGAGSDEIFAMACQAFLAEGDNIVQPQYGFAAWAIAARAVGARVKSAAEPRHAVDVDAILETVDARTRIVFVANPANPTGAYLPFSEVKRLHARLSSDVLLVLDGAYAECASCIVDFADGLAWSRPLENVLVTRTFSKMYGLASLRVGWGYAPSAVAVAMNRIRLPFSVPRAGEAAAIAALGDDAFLSRSLAQVTVGRARLANALDALGLATLPSATNFVTVSFADAALSATDVERRLAGRGILVRGLRGYGLPDFLRITVGTGAENEAVIAAIGEMLS